MRGGRCHRDDRTAVAPGCLCDFSTQLDPWRASTLAWRIRTDNNGLLGARESVDLIFKLGNVLLSLGQGAITRPPRCGDWP